MSGDAKMSGLFGSRSRSKPRGKQTFPFHDLCFHSYLVLIASSSSSFT